VYGDSLQSWLVAICVIDGGPVKKWADEKGISCERSEDLSENKDLKKAILDDLLEIAKANKFSGLEKIKKIHITKDPFTIENDVLTPTLKIKRNIAKKVY